MKRVIVLNWKQQTANPLEVFSNLKLLCESYPAYNYNTLNNYLSKGKVAFENEEVRIERKLVHTSSIPQRKIKLLGKKLIRKFHDQDAEDRAFWLTRPIVERLDAVTQLRKQFIKKNQRMDRSLLIKRKR